MTLSGMIMFAGPITSASINPAVSISQTVLSESVLQQDGFMKSFWCVYMLGPIAGGVFAGLFSWAHAYALDSWVEKDGQKEDAKADADEEHGTTN